MNYSEAVSKYRANKTKENLENQAAGLLNAMTLKEKIRMIHGKMFFPQVMKNVFLHGSVFYTPFRGGGCRRLGIPEIKFTDGPRGVVCYRATCLPAAMLRASSFDPELEYRIGKMIAKEAAAAGANFFAGICINLVRNPRWGRCQETYGEETCLLGKMGAALVTAVQEEGIIACPKHFALNSIEDRRFYADARADERTLREVYLQHFKECVDAGATSIMSAYNKVNGQYCAENEALLRDILRGEWGFEGFVMSDFMWGVHNTEKALKAGLDMEMPLPRYYNVWKIRKLLREGSLSAEQLDTAAGNILRALLLLTSDIKPIAKTVIGCEEHCRLSREAAAKGMVLLKNDGLLPLKKDTKIAVTGPYAGVVNTGDKGSSQVKSRYHITPYQGIKRAFGGAALYNGTSLPKALKAAEDAGAVVVCAGFDHRTEGELIMKARYGARRKRAGKGGDRERLSLSREEIELIKGLKEVGKSVIVCLIAGGAVLTNEWKEYADAIIMMYYSGLEGGNALADILYGDVCPGGKLPFTVAKDERDYPAFMEFGDKPYEIDYGYYHGYTLLEKKKTEPEYPFGFGLSYTTFDINDIRLQQPAGEISLSALIKNTGSLKGSEVIQVYAGSEETGKDRPVKLLKGFKRVELEPGEEKRVNIKIKTDELKFYDPIKKAWELDKGYIFYVGNSSSDAERNRLKVQF